MATWRMPHTMPADGSPVLVAYRWSAKGKIYVTVGCWFTKGTYPGVVEYPDGAYLPCVGWVPMPTGEHPEFLPMHLRGNPELEIAA